MTHLDEGIALEILRFRVDERFLQKLSIPLTRLARFERSLDLVLERDDWDLYSGCLAIAPRPPGPAKRPWCLPLRPVRRGPRRRRVLSRRGLRCATPDCTPSERTMFPKYQSATHICGSSAWMFSTSQRTDGVYGQCMGHVRPSFRKQTSRWGTEGPGNYDLRMRAGEEHRLADSWPRTP